MLPWESIIWLNDHVAMQLQYYFFIPCHVFIYLFCFCTNLVIASPPSPIQHPVTFEVTNSMDSTALLSLLSHCFLWHQMHPHGGCAFRTKGKKDYNPAYISTWSTPSNVSLFSVWSKRTLETYRMSFLDPRFYIQHREGCIKEMFYIILEANFYNIQYNIQYRQNHSKIIVL